MAQEAAEAGDDGTNDLLVSDVIRRNELQVWFLSEHLVAVPLVRADSAKAAAAILSAVRIRPTLEGGDITCPNVRTWIRFAL